MCFTLRSQPVSPTSLQGFFSLNLLQYYYGKETSNKAIYISIFILASFTVLSIFQLTYTPSVHDKMHCTYKSLLDPVPRVFISSILIGFLAQKIDLFLQRFLRNRWPKIPFIFALFLPVCISQAFDTFAFSFIALYEKMQSVLTIATVSYITKLLTILSMGFFVNFSKKWIKTRRSV